MEPKKGLTFEEKTEKYNSQIDELAGWIIKQMQAGEESWTMPWHKGIPQAQNAYSGRFYGGNNLVLLWKKCLEKEFEKNKWATFRQWRKMKATLKRGEKGTLICIAIPKQKKENKKGQQPQPTLFHSGKAEKENLYFKFKFLHVFNQSQVTGYFGDQPDLFNPAAEASSKIKQFIENTEAIIKIGGGTAYYSTLHDYIQMPELIRFKDSKDFRALDEYQGTLLHELVHWTGHKSRCKRTFGEKFGSPSYAFEELVAELGSAILSTHFHKKVYPREQHAQYLTSWIKVLKNDFSYFTDALELARYAIYWLFLKTNVYPFDLKEQHERIMDERKVQHFESLVAE
jgi:antirestriction protein ArdC